MCKPSPWLLKVLVYLKALMSLFTHSALLNSLLHSMLHWIINKIYLSSFTFSISSPCSCTLSLFHVLFFKQAGWLPTWAFHSCWKKNAFFWSTGGKIIGKSLASIVTIKKVTSSWLGTTKGCLITSSLPLMLVCDCTSEKKNAKL